MKIALHPNAKEHVYVYSQAEADAVVKVHYPKAKFKRKEEWWVDKDGSVVASILES